MTFNPTECSRLIAEAREDDERMSPAPWHAADAIAPKILMYSVPSPRPVREVDYLGETYCDQDQQGRRNCNGLARTRNNLRALADQLAAAVEEVERLRNLVGEACDVANAALNNARTFDGEAPKFGRIAEIRKEAGCV